MTTLAGRAVQVKGDVLDTSGDEDAGVDVYSVWTGTDGHGHFETQPSSGSPLDDACKGWTSASSSLTGVEGRLGAVASDAVPGSNWTDGSPDGLDTCAIAARLYCFEK